MNILYQSRTHPKVLFRIIIIQLFLIAAHVVGFMFIKDFSNEFLNKYAGWSFHLFIIALELYYVIVPFLQWRVSNFIVTENKVRSEWGLLYKNSKEIDLSHVVSVNEERGILDRILGCGTLVFYSAADSRFHNNKSSPWNRKQSDSGLRFYDVKNIKKVRQIVEEARYNK